MEMTLTKNFWANIHTLLFCMSMNKTPGTVVTYNDGFYNAQYVTVLGGFKDTSGNTQTAVAGDVGGFPYASHLQPFTFNSSSGYGTYFAIGSGTTAATVDDYNVETAIANASLFFTGQNSLNGSCTFHVTATATADISVSEICMLKKLKTRESGTDYTVLLGRTVLDEPVTLANGQNKTFDITISLPKPTA